MVREAGKKEKNHDELTAKGMGKDVAPATTSFMQRGEDHLAPPFHLLEEY